MGPGVVYTAPSPSSMAPASFLDSACSALNLKFATISAQAAGDSASQASERDLTALDVISNLLLESPPTLRIVHWDNGHCSQGGRCFLADAGEMRTLLPSMLNTRLCLFFDCPV